MEELTAEREVKDFFNRIALFHDEPFSFSEAWRRVEIFHLRPRETASPADISRLDLGDVARFRPLYGYERVNSCSSYELIRTDVESRNSYVLQIEIWELFRGRFAENLW